MKIIVDSDKLNTENLDLYIGEDDTASPIVYILYSNGIEIFKSNYKSQIEFIKKFLDENFNYMLKELIQKASE